MSVCSSNHDSDAGIGIVHFGHSLIGFAETTISNRDVDIQFECILAKDNALTQKGPIWTDFVEMFFNWWSSSAKSTYHYIRVKQMTTCMQIHSWMTEQCCQKTSCWYHQNMMTILHVIQGKFNTTILLMTHSTMSILITKEIKMTMTVSPFTVLTVLIK